METVSIILILLVAVVVSGLLARLLPVPLPILQIFLGAVLSGTLGLGITLHPDVFFLVFLPPLLFLDGWRIPKRELFRDSGTIGALAVGLVLFTVLGIGLLVHAMIPSMPLPVAFALAAVLSPTDATALSAVTARAPVPDRLKNILAGESLLNDASGLVCLRFATVAALTGAFSLSDAVLTFAQLAAGGIAIGTVVSWTVMRGQRALVQHVGEDPAGQTLISLLIPFGAYLLAEHLHTSGILAAVAAGITMSYTENSGRVLGATRMRRTVVWDTVQFAANGVIFVLLGEQLPGILASAAKTLQEAGDRNAAWLAAYVLVIVVAMALLRLFWVWASMRLTLYRAARRGKAEPHVPRRVLLATSLAGVRGAVTLAGVLTLPLTTLDGAPFPTRDLAIFLAMGVVLVSLVAATLLLPPLLRSLKLPAENAHAQEEQNARKAAAAAALQAIRLTEAEMAKGKAKNDVYTEAAARISEPYILLTASAETPQDALERGRQLLGAEKTMQLAALRAEREELYRLRRTRRIRDDTLRQLVDEIDLAVARHSK